MPKKSEHFTAYALAEVPFQRIDRRHYYTISRSGVTLFSRVENHFTPLNVWQTEYRQYCRLMQIHLFATFRLWKGFKVWYKGIVWRKFHATRKFLQENLFAAIVPLAKALLVLRGEYYRFMVMSFVDVSQRENQHMFYFIEAQMLTYERARDALIEYRQMMTSVLCMCGENCGSRDKPVRIDDSLCVLLSQIMPAMRPSEPRAICRTTRRWSTRPSRSCAR